MKLTEAWKREGFKQFFKRYLCLIFVIAIYAPLYNLFFYYLVSKNPLVNDFLINPGKFGIFIDVSSITLPLVFLIFMISIILPIFFALIFFILAKNKLVRIKKYNHNIKQAKLFLFILLLFHLFFALFLEYMINFNLAWIVLHPWQTLFIFSLIVIFSLFILLGVFFDFNFIRLIYRDFRKEVKISLLITFSGLSFGIFLYFFFWQYLALFISQIVLFFLHITYPNASLFFKESIPYLTAEGVSISIVRECTGIESIALFLVFYFASLLLDWNKINKKKAFLLAIFGVFGLQLVNIVRIYLLMVVAIEYDAGFAYGFFHNNIAWIIFIPYFILFYELTYRYVRSM